MEHHARRPPARHRQADGARAAPDPDAAPTDVVVNVKACNVVPNLKNVLATYAEWFPYLPLPQLPAIFGLDSAGVVTAVGNHVTRRPGR